MQNSYPIMTRLLRNLLIDLILSSFQKIEILLHLHLILGVKLLFNGANVKHPLVLGNI